MKLEDIKVGMKVKLLGKHALFDEYDNIDDWYEDCIGWEEVQKIKEQGFGVVTNIDEDVYVWVADDIGNCVWCFLPSDLEPYEEKLLLPIGTKIRQIKPRFGEMIKNNDEFEIINADKNHVFAKSIEVCFKCVTINKQELEECWEVVKDKWEDRWHSHGLVQYKVHSNGKKVKVKIASGDVGVAICAEDDEFDLEKGISIAKNRATIKKLEKQIKKLSK